MLFKRLWSNHRGYTLLHNNSLPLESDIILRSGVENAICIAANYRLREEFTVLIQMDVLATTLGQIKTNREDVPDDLLRDQETFIRNVTAKLPEGKKPAYLNWKKLAELGQVPQLYKDYRTLSSGSAHVTGMSIIRGVVYRTKKHTKAARFFVLFRRPQSGRRKPTNCYFAKLFHASANIAPASALSIILP